MNDPLDKRLKQWAADTAPAAEDLARLRQRITDEAARACGEALRMAPPARAPFAIKLFYSLAGAAAMLIAVCALWTMFGSDTAQPGRDTLADATTVPALDIELGRKLFSEIDRMFPERLRWVAESNGDMGMGIESAPTGIVENGVPMFVRLTLVARHDSEHAWRPTWSADMLVRSEDAVEIVPSPHADNHLSLWIYPLTDGHILVDSRVSLATPLPLAAVSEAVVQPGRPLQLSAGRRNNTDYRLYQTVWTLTAQPET
jgi:hypothetical protein